MPDPTRPRDASRTSAATAAPALWQVRLLGGFALSDGQTQLTRLASRAACALLARLALFPERAHAREELVELLWPGVALEVGRNRLRQTLSVLRSTLEPAGRGAGAVILADRMHLRVAPQALACDAVAFEAALRRGDDAAARACYQGELLPGFYDEWIADERLRLEALADRLPEAVPLRAPRSARAPSAADAVPARPVLPHYLTPVFGIDLVGARLREAIAAHRLVTLVGPGGSGKTRLAVEVARVLAAPDPGWTRWQGWVAFVPLVQCRSAAQLLDRLVMTLRLDEGASDPLERVRQALAGRSALLVLDNLEQVAGPAAELVTELLSALPLLHVVATSRHVLGVDGEHLLEIEPLPLPRLAAPHDELALSPAVALFVDRARERRADFHLGAQNAAAVAELVVLLEGHPLAIELAAARVRSTPPAQWVSLLREARQQRASGQPGDTLALLARAGPRGQADARHASMLQVIAWSWDLLSAGQQQLLAALSVFDGGCDAEAARAVFDPQGSRAAVQEALDVLVSNSLVTAHAPTVGDGAETAPDASQTLGGLRFMPYEAVREFAAAQVDAGQRLRWRARHRAWLVGLAHTAEAAPHAARGVQATPDLARLREEMPNLLLALATALHDAQTDAAWALVWAHRAAFADITLPATGITLLEAHLVATQAAALRLLGHAFLAPQCFESGDHQAARRHADAVIAALPDPAALAMPAWHEGPPADSAEPLPAWALGWALRIRMRVGEPVAADDPLLKAAQAQAQAAGALALQAKLIGLEASLRMRNHGDHVGAEPLRRTALALWQASGNRLRANEGRVALAICLGFQHRIDEQLVLLREVEDEARALGQPRLRCFALSVRGYALADLHRHAEAVAAFHACLTHAARAAAWRELFYGLWNLPRSLAHLREPERAARLMGFAEAFFAARFGTLGPEDQREARRTRRLVAVQLGPAAAAAAWNDGRDRLDLSAALTLAFA